MPTGLGQHGLQAGVGDEDGARGIEGPVLERDLRGAPGAEAQGQPLRGRPRTRLRHPPDHRFAEKDRIARMQRGRLGQHRAVEGRPIQGLQVHDMGLAIPEEDPGMDPAHGIGLDPDGGLLAPSQGHALLRERHGVQGTVNLEGELHVGTGGRVSLARGC